MLSKVYFLIWAAILISTVAPVTNPGSLWPDNRYKRQAWINENWGTILPITYEPEILSRQSDESCNCIEANLCPEFLKMLPYRTTHGEHLRRVTCGFRGFHPLVCCNQICEHMYITASPTPFHNPGVYYNIPDDKMQGDDPYTQATSERNYYSKRFSHDSAFHQNENSFVTPRTFNVYPDYIIKTHDIPAQMYPEVNHPTHKPHYPHMFPSDGHWSSKPSANNPPYHYYPKYPFNPMFTPHKSDSDVENSHFPNKHDHHLPKYPTSNPSVDNSNYPNKINVTLDHVPEHPFHPVPTPFEVESNVDNGKFPNKVNTSAHPLHPMSNPPANNSTLGNTNFSNNTNSSNDDFSTSTVLNDHNLNTFDLPPSSKTNPHEGMSSNSTDDKAARRKERRKLLPTIECGVAPGERILGGKSAVLGEYPWIARIGYTRSGSDALVFRCAGSLINSRYVVTAAHCVSSLPTGLNLARIRLGELDERTDPDCSQLECADPIQDFLPSKIRIHEQYNTPRFRHDMALVRLDRPVTFSNYVSPICLPFDSLSNKSYVGLKSDTAGWGATDLGAASSSPVLQWVRVTVISNEECARLFAERTGTRLGYGQICAGGERGQDSCEGDSGGPLMRGEQLGPEDFTRYYLLGLVSFGAKWCGSENLPGVYTDIPMYLDWILDNIEP